jgi:chromosome segregation ATPase
LLQIEAEKQTLRTALAETEVVRSGLEAELKGVKQTLLETRDLMTGLQGDAVHTNVEKQKLEAKLVETAQLQAAAENELREANASRSSLEGEILKLRSEVEAARSQTAELHSLADGKAQHPDIGRVRPERVNKEIQRVEEMLTNAMKLIQDSSVELSLVMRKSNECKELQSYLRGIRFAAEMETTEE